jgi:two-component system, NtrC family, sensor kinase
MMSLRRKLVYQITGLVLSMLLVGCAALWGFEALRSDFSAALDGYQRLDDLNRVGSHVAAARMLLETAPPQPIEAKTELQTALRVFNEAFVTDTDAVSQATGALPNDVRQALESTINSVGVSGEIDAASIEPILRPMIDLDARYRQIIEIAQQRATRRQHLFFFAMTGLLAGVALVAALIGMAQYRSVLWPLMRMKFAVERIAAGRFNGRVHTEGTREFAELASNFNRMAARLEDLYHNLQQNVEAKSKQLLRNERLASVGLLAAGVAHEINNPLSIMTAHAELSIGAIERGDESAIDESSRSLTVICEEAYRCKRIVEKLLTLGRGPQEHPTIFPLGELVREVVGSVGAMPNYHDRQLILEHESGSADLILGRTDEIKQVVLNLLFNALEATPAGGEVRVTVMHDARVVSLSIADTGRGMSAAVLEQIFEPFYTDPSGKSPQESEGRRGTGLGLSIAHAIVVRHGGEIRAQSDGPGRGSRFTVTFPVAAGDVDQELDA